VRRARRRVRIEPGLPAAAQDGILEWSFDRRADRPTRQEMASLLTSSQDAVQATVEIPGWMDSAAADHCRSRPYRATFPPTNFSPHGSVPAPAKRRERMRKPQPPLVQRATVTCRRYSSSGQILHPDQRKYFRDRVRRLRSPRWEHNQPSSHCPIGQCRRIWLILHQESLRRTRPGVNQRAVEALRTWR